MYQVLLSKEFCRNECTHMRETVDDGKIYFILFFPFEIHIVIDSRCTSERVGAGIPSEHRRVPNLYKTLVCNWYVMQSLATCLNKSVGNAYDRLLIAAKRLYVLVDCYLRPTSVIQLEVETPQEYSACTSTL